jgi:hypothetical protein
MSRGGDTPTLELAGASNASERSAEEVCRAEESGPQALKHRRIFNGLRHE